MIKKIFSFIILLIFLINNINFVSASNNLPEKLIFPDNKDELMEYIDYYLYNSGRLELKDRLVKYNESCNLDNGKDLSVKIIHIFSDFISDLIGEFESNELDKEGLEYTYFGMILKSLNDTYIKDKVDDGIGKVIDNNYDTENSKENIGIIKDKFIDGLVEKILKEQDIKKEHEKKIEKILKVFLKSFSEKYLEESIKNNDLSFKSSVVLFLETFKETLFSPLTNLLDGNFYENINFTIDIGKFFVDLFLDKNNKKIFFLGPLKDMVFKLVKLQFDCQEFFIQRIKDNHNIAYNLPIINREFIYNMSLLYMINQKYNKDLGYESYNDLNDGKTREEYINQEYKNHLGLCLSNVKKQADVNEKGGNKVGEVIRKSWGGIKGFFIGKNLKEQYIQDETLKQCGFDLELNSGDINNINYEQLYSISSNVIYNYLDYYNIDKGNINKEIINFYILTKFLSFDDYIKFIENPIITISEVSFEYKDYDSDNGLEGIIFIGDVYSKDIDEIYVIFYNTNSNYKNDRYKLSKFKKGDNNFTYNAFRKYEVLDFGNNIYRFQAYSKGKLVKEIKEVIKINKGLYTFSNEKDNTYNMENKGKNEEKDEEKVGLFQKLLNKIKLFFKSVSLVFGRNTLPEHLKNIGNKETSIIYSVNNNLNGDLESINKIKGFEKLNNITDFNGFSASINMKYSVLDSFFEGILGPLYFTDIEILTGDTKKDLNNEEIKSSLADTIDKMYPSDMNHIPAENNINIKDEENGLKSIRIGKNIYDDGKIIENKKFMDFANKMNITEDYTYLLFVDLEKIINEWLYEYPQEVGFNFISKANAGIHISRGSGVNLSKSVTTNSNNSKFDIGDFKEYLKGLISEESYNNIDYFGVIGKIDIEDNKNIVNIVLATKNGDYLSKNISDYQKLFDEIKGMIKVKDYNISIDGKYLMITFGEGVGINNEEVKEKNKIDKFPDDFLKSNGYKLNNLGTIQEYYNSFILNENNGYYRNQTIYKEGDNVLNFGIIYSHGVELQIEEPVRKTIDLSDYDDSYPSEIGQPIFGSFENKIIITDINTIKLINKKKGINITLWER